MTHESFEDYATRWRLEASKIRPLVPEEELVQTFVWSLDGIYYQKLFGLCIQSFDDLILIGKRLEYGIRTGKVIDVSAIQATFQALKASPKEEKEEDISTIPPQEQYYPNTQQAYAIFNTYNPQGFQYPNSHQQDPILSNSHQPKKMKCCSFTPLTEPLSNIFQRLFAQGVLKPRKGWIPKYTPSILTCPKGVHIIQISKVMILRNVQH